MSRDANDSLDQSVDQSTNLLTICLSLGWIDHIWVSENVDVSMVLSPPIRSGDLEANQKAREFSPIPNKVS